MIMANDNRCGIVLQPTPQNLSRVDMCAVDGAAEHNLKAKLLFFALRNRQAKASWGNMPIRFRKYSETAEGS